MAEARHLAVELQNLTKSFGPVVANSDISVQVRSGTVHAIVGENGAGKSTAMNLLYGLYAPDSGKIFIEGVEKKFLSPADAQRAGLGMVHQHFSLSEPESVLDNIILGAETVGSFSRILPAACRPIDRKSAKNKLNAIVAQYGLPIDLNARIETLPLGLKQRVEILKLLYRNAQILILDEPTAVLTPQETEFFFENLRKLREQGKTILMITHKLKEVLALSNEVSVFCAGRVVGHCATRDTNEEELAQLMVGRNVVLFSKPLEAETNATAAALFKVENLNLYESSRKILSDLNFSIYPGEIVGIAGVQGNGQSELEKVLLDPQRFFAAGHADGKIFLSGKDITACSTSELFNEGAAFVCEDRLKEGLIAELRLDENFLLGLQHFPRFCSKGRILWKAVEAATTEALQKFRIKAPGVQAKARALSGGNQQKLIIARELCKNPKFLVVAQPTRGVDIGAIEFIHGKLRERQLAGAGILLISSELSEILSLSNRILVFFKGKIVAEYKNAEANEQKLGLAMGGAAL